MRPPNQGLDRYFETVDFSAEAAGWACQHHRSPSVRSRHEAVVLLAVALAACQTVRTTQPGVVGVDRSNRSVSSASINSGRPGIPQDAFGGAAQGQSSDSARTERLRNRAPADPHTGAFRARSRLALGSQSHHRQINAWCMPGGKIAFIPASSTAKLSDEIAAVMGHEIARPARACTRARLANHGAEYQHRRRRRGGGRAGRGDGFVKWSSTDLQPPNSHSDETEADRIRVSGAALRSACRGHLWAKMQRGGDQAAQGREQAAADAGALDPPAHATRIADLRFIPNA
jgi:hypothetical protein